MFVELAAWAAFAAQVAAPPQTGGAERSAADGVALCADVNRRLEGGEGEAPVDLGLAQICELDWMFGRWRVTTEDEDEASNEVFASMDPAIATITPALGGYALQIHRIYPSRTEDLRFIAYNAGETPWVSVAIQFTGETARATSAGWTDGRAVFEGDLFSLAGRVRERLTFERTGVDEFVVKTSLYDGKSWRPRDTFDRYRRNREDRPQSGEGGAGTGDPWDVRSGGSGDPAAARRGSEASCAD